MPELPEVETVRRGLAPVMAGRAITRLECRRPDLRFPFPDKFAARVQGRCITTLNRRAKYLVAGIEGGDVLLMHLGMSGRFTISPSPHTSWGEGRGEGQDRTAVLAAAPHPNPLPMPSAGARGEGNVGSYVHSTGGDPRHDHVVFHMEGGATVTYNDPRRFGFMLLIPGREFDDHPLMKGLGVEPLGNGLNAAYLAARAHGRKADLKAFLLDQRNIAGLGNIYVSEALHRAAISPHRAAACLSTAKGQPTERCERVIPSIRTVLEAAIDAGGSSLRDYKQADGALGYFQHQFLVYDRDGEACLRDGCKGIVRRTIQAGRSTFHCPSCQR